MADQWRLVQDGSDMSLERNGRWYTGVDDKDEAEAILRNQRASKYVLVEADGYVTTMRL